MTYDEATKPLADSADNISRAYWDGVVDRIRGVLKHSKHKSDTFIEAYARISLQAKFVSPAHTLTHLMNKNWDGLRFHADQLEQQQKKLKHHLSIIETWAKSEPSAEALRRISCERRDEYAQRLSERSHCATTFSNFVSAYKAASELIEVADEIERKNDHEPA